MSQTKQNNLIKLIELPKNKYNLVYPLMEKSFPLTERRSAKSHQNLSQEDHYQVIVAVDDISQMNILGFYAFWHLENLDVYFLEHIAVEPETRGMGIGSILLNDLQQRAKGQECSIILEIEEPIDYITKKRLKFYERDFFKLNDYQYRQPPYDNAVSLNKTGKQSNLDYDKNLPCKISEMTHEDFQLNQNYNQWLPLKLMSWPNHLNDQQHMEFVQHAYREVYHVI